MPRRQLDSMRSARKGFTLIELLVVISIIGILATIVLVAGEKARGQGRNAERTAAVLQYKSAIELSYDANNAYIDSELGGKACLGIYDDGTCWHGDTPPVTTSNRLDAAFEPFIQGPQRPPATNLTWDGIVYQRCDASSYEMRWFLEGKSQDCKGGTVLNGDYLGTGTTLCQFVQNHGCM